MEPITTNSEPDNAGVNCYPPTLLFIMLLIGLALDFTFRLPLDFGVIGLAIGIMLGLDAITLILWSARQLIKAGTAVPPNRPTKSIVQTGPLRFSRNPIYIGFLIGHAALALLFDSLWIALMLPIFFLYLDRYVIPKEEAYLTRKFGPEYEAYRNRVRRWF